MLTPIQQTMTAIREGTLGEFQAFLAQYPHLLKEYGGLMMEHAADHDRIEVMEALLAAGIDINSRNATDTPLSSAAKNASVETVEWLLEHGADINGRSDRHGSTPLHEAITEGRRDMVEFLLDRGADPDILEGNPQRNALAAARFWGHDEIVAFLEGRGIAEIRIEPEPVNVESESFLVGEETGDIINWFEIKWGPVYEYGEKHGLTAMCDKNRVLFLVGYLIDQICNGGIEMVYGNPSANYTTEMPAALEKIGAARAAQVIRDSNALFPGGAPAKDMRERAEQVVALDDPLSALGEQLEAIFDEWLPDGGERKLMVQLYDYWHGKPGI